MFNEWDPPISLNGVGPTGLEFIFAGDARALIPAQVTNDPIVNPFYANDLYSGLPVHPCRPRAKSRTAPGAPPATRPTRTALGDISYREPGAPGSRFKTVDPLKGVTLAPGEGVDFNAP